MYKYLVKYSPTCLWLAKIILPEVWQDINVLLDFSILIRLTKVKSTGFWCFSYPFK